MVKIVSTHAVLGWLNMRDRHKVLQAFPESQTGPRMSFTKLLLVLRRVLGFVLLCMLYTCVMVLIITAIRVSDNVPAGETAINFRYEVF